MVNDLFKIALTVLPLLCPMSSKGQTAEDTKLLGQGVYSSDFRGVFSGIHNQAALSGLKHFTAGAIISQRFSMKALTNIQFALAIPSNAGTFSIRGMTFGYERLRRQQLKGGY